MTNFGRININPPLLNSASPWASDLNDLTALYASKFTGAVTTRTATLNGFPDDPAIHQVAFTSDTISSLNSYGYSPHPLSSYIGWVRDLLSSNPSSRKPIIISITSPIGHNPVAEEGADVRDTELETMISAIQQLRLSLMDVTTPQRVAIEINTSCPNIKDAPPPAYQPEKLKPLLLSVQSAVRDDPTLVVGLKLPPYVYSSQFSDLIAVVSSFTTEVDNVRRNPISFFTCTNTLGSSLLFNSQTTKVDETKSFAVPSVYGGLAGQALHPLALGNVHSFATLLRDSQDPALQAIEIIGVGGVTSPDAVARMRQAGATAVGCATILGREGVAVFESLSKGLS